ncbi:MAG: cyclic nucleotide-binding domain-containing protein, partial [Comamonadaceae bacterium]
MAATETVEVETRRHQMFPTLADADIVRIRRFGTVRQYERGSCLFRAGEPGPGMFVVLQGVVAISQRDGLGHVELIANQGVGQFLAEVGQLSGRPALVDGHAEEDVEVLLVPS